MVEMIDEEKLIEQLEKLKNGCWIKAKEENNICFARKALIISQIIGIINIQPKISNEISCNGCLPEELQNCINEGGKQKYDRAENATDECLA